MRAMITSVKIPAAPPPIDPVAPLALDPEVDLRFLALSDRAAPDQVVTAEPTIPRCTEGEVRLNSRRHGADYPGSRVRNRRAFGHIVLFWSSRPADGSSSSPARPPAAAGAALPGRQSPRTSSATRSSVSWTGFRPTIDGLYSVTIMQCRASSPPRWLPATRPSGRRRPTTTTAAPCPTGSPDRTAPAIPSSRSGRRSTSRPSTAPRATPARWWRSRTTAANTPRSATRERRPPLRTKPPESRPSIDLRRHHRRGGLGVSGVVLVERPHCTGAGAVHVETTSRARSRPRELPERADRCRHRIRPGRRRGGGGIRSGAGVRTSISPASSWRTTCTTRRRASASLT